MPLLCRAQEQYKSVETTDLLKAPQKYWARAIVFKDTLIEPPRDARVDIEGKRYAAFTTREIGVCYASADLLPAMSDLEVNREYLFSGTVFQNRGRYVPVVQSYTPAIDAQKLSADVKTVAAETPDSFTNESVRPMADLLAAVQGAQVAYAKEKNIPLCQLYDPSSEHYVKAMDIARTAIYNSEQKNNTASAEILAQYLSTVLAKQCAPGSATQAVIGTESAPPSENQEPTTEVEETPGQQPTNVVPRKLSWSERRAQAAAKKDAERKAKKERDAARAAEETARKKAEKAAADYQAQQMKIQQAAEIPAATTTPARIQIPEAPKQAAPATNITPAAASPGQKPAGLSWFQRWKIERQKRAVIKAELRRIEEAEEAAAKRLAADKKAEEQRRAEEKKAQELKQKQEAERLKTEAKKAKPAAAQKPPAGTTQPSTTKPANGNGIYLPVGR